MPVDETRDRRRGGRPRKDDPGSAVSTWVPATIHDRLIQLANQHDVSVSTYVKDIVIRHVDKRDP